MKTYSEWQTEQNEDENLINRISELTHQIETELKSFQGERFEGFLEMIGSLRALQMTLAEIKHGGSSDGMPKAPTAMVKSNYKHAIPKKVRDEEKEEMDPHHQGHIAHHGDVGKHKIFKF